MAFGSEPALKLVWIGDVEIAFNSLCIVISSAGVVREKYLGVLLKVDALRKVSWF